MDKPITDEDHADRVIMELEMECRRLRGFIRKLAERIADASEVLGKVAERKEMRKVESSASR